MEPALYINGQPQNLAAAAWDALEWLRLLANPQNRRLHQALTPDARRRVVLCRDALERFVQPHLPEESVTAEGDLEHLADELREIFNPDGHVCVELPSGGVARVAPDCPPETLEALNRAAQAAVAHFDGGIP